MKSIQNITTIILIVTAIFIAIIVLYCAFFIKSNKITILHHSNSAYGSIWVYQTAKLRCLSVSDPSYTSSSNSTCIFRKQPIVPAFNYYKMALGSMYINSHPSNALIIGLGGGALAQQLTFLLPNIKIDIVDINPEMLRLAKEYFAFEESNNIKVYITDGLDYVTKAVTQGIKYDLIIVDAFTEDYIPEAFLTLHFVKMLRDILSTNGSVAFNTFHNSPYYKLESALFLKTFGEFYNLDDNNRIMIASREQLPLVKDLFHKAEQLKEKFHNLDIDENWLLSKFILIKN